ncbi:MAG: Metallophos protein, partial [Chloroflexi bacterium]|nr:Metallophos protein [Chloroflexota bacterium]
AGTGGADLLTVLTPDRASVDLEALDVVVHGPVFATKRAPHSPLRDIDIRSGPSRTWHIGMVHGSIAIAGQTDRDEVVITTEEIAASGLDYLALGHWHSTSRGKAGHTVHAYSGAPEPVALDQDRAGKCLVVTLDQHNNKKVVDIKEHQVGRTRFEKVELDAATVASQPALIEQLGARGDADLILDARLIGVRPDALDLHVEEVEAALAGRFLKIRVRDRSVPALTVGPIPPQDTVLGAYIRDVEAAVAELESAGNDDAAGELRDALRLGRLLLAGEEVTL